MIIVFGANGFIGSYLVKELLNQDFVVCPVDIVGEGLKVDIANWSSFKQLPINNISCVVNLACFQPCKAKGKVRSDKYTDANSLGVEYILNFCLLNNIPKFIHTVSYRGVQALWNGKYKIKEGDIKALPLYNEFTPYAISESLALQYIVEKQGLNSIIFRIPSVFGFGGHMEGFKQGKPFTTGLKTFIDNAIEGKEIKVFGDVTKKRPFIAVQDVVSAIILGIKSDKVHGLYNLAYDKPLSLQEEVEQIIDVFDPNRKCDIEYQPDIPNNIEPFRVDNSKVKKELGWQPRYSFKDILVDYKRELCNLKD